MQTALTREQVAAMDDTMRAAKTRADLACLQHSCGIVDEPHEGKPETLEQRLIRRIAHRQHMLATQPMTWAHASILRQANDDDAQQLALIENQREREADAEQRSSRIAAEVGHMLLTMGVVLAAILAVHLIVRATQ